MNAQQFLAEFGHIANAPGGVEQLRQLVLQKAFCGDLSNSSLTSEGLLNSIRLQMKEFKGNNKKLKIPKKHPGFSVFFDKYDIPKNWSWLSISEIGANMGQKVPDDDFYYLDVSSVNGIKGISKSGLKLVGSNNAPSRARKIVQKGDLLYSTVRPYLRNVFIFEGGYEKDVIASTAFAVISTWEGILNKYVFYYLISPLFQSYVMTYQVGAAYPALNDKQFFSAMIPVPPTEEQAQIVAKVDELMALCDRLEQQQQDKRTLQNQLRQASLEALANASSPYELQQHWQRLEKNFGRLFAQGEDIDDLQRLIKTLSVEGKLSIPSTDTVDLQSIANARRNLFDEYKNRKLIRTQKTVSVKEPSVDYPDNWQVVPFDDVAIVIGGVTKGRNLKGKQVMNCPYLSVANVQRGYFDLSAVKNIDIAEDELAKYRVERGDLLITEGGDWDKVGRTAVWQQDFENYLHQNHVFKARVPTPKIMNEWVELVFNSNIGRDYFAGASKQTTNLASINMTQLRSFPFPVPPLAEQKEILGTARRLEKIISIWVEQQSKKAALSKQLATATIAQLTGQQTPEEQAPMKAPKTRLQAPLELGQNQPGPKDNAPLAALIAREAAKKTGAKTRLEATDLFQRFGGDDIDAFYAQLKTEVAHGWIKEPQPARMLELDDDAS